MKKILSLMLVVTMMVLALSGCGEETFKCGLCGRQVTQEPHNVEVLGQKAKICADCYAAVDTYANLFG